MDVKTLALGPAPTTPDLFRPAPTTPDLFTL